MPVLNRLYDGSPVALQNLAISLERCEPIPRGRNGQLRFVVSDIVSEEPRA